MNYTGVLDVHDHLLIEEEMVHGRDERVALPLVGVGEVHLEPIPGDHQVRLADSLEHLVTMTTVPTEVGIDVPDPGDSIALCVPDDVLDDSECFRQFCIGYSRAFPLVCREICVYE